MLDVGGNVGSFSRLAAEAVGGAGRVVCVEPAPPVFEALRRNVAAHREWCRRRGVDASGTETLQAGE